MGHETVTQKRNSAAGFNFSKPVPKRENTAQPSPLQHYREIGNQAVQRLLASGTIQAKLTIGQPNDKYEQEADRVSDQVMRMPEGKPSSVNGHSLLVQRKPLCPECDEKEEDEMQVQFKQSGNQTPQITPGIQSQIQSLKGGGQPLPQSTRNFFESRFGKSFADVRVHTDSNAAKAAKSINAKAFTIGDNVAFGTGQYSPNTSIGRRLIAHELTHVVQQAPVASRQPQEKATEKPLSPEEEFLRDLDSGTKKAMEYIDYISQAVDYWQKYGVKPGNLDDVLNNLSKIASTVNNGLGRFSGVIGTAIQLLETKKWFEQLDNVVNTTRNLNMKDRASVEAWVNSMKGLKEKSKPFLESAGNWLAGMAVKGSRAAGRASFFLSVLTAYAEVGHAALDAGLKNVNKYLERQEKIISGFEEPSRKPHLPPEPYYPGDWSTTAEVREQARTKKKILEMLRKRREEEQKAREATEDFNENVFPGIYMANRRKLMQKIYRDMGRTLPQDKFVSDRGTAVLPGVTAGHWWDALTSTDGPSYFDKNIGAYIVPIKGRITKSEAEREIENFHFMSRNPCPHFDKLYRSSLEAHLRQKLGTPAAPW